jgi:hypothetical protein
MMAIIDTWCNDSDMCDTGMIKCICGVPNGT